MVGIEGLEPPRITPQDSKSCAAAITPYAQKEKAAKNNVCSNLVLLFVGLP